MFRLSVGDIYVFCVDNFLCNDIGRPRPTNGRAPFASARWRIRDKVLGGVVTFFLISLTVAPIPAQGKPTAPVSIEYNVPPNVQMGDTVSTAIQFVAEADMEQLEVSVAPYEGVEIISKSENVVFQNVRSGEKREIQVTVRLTNKVGYLSVFATTIITQRASRKVIAIRYGTAGDVTNQKLKPQQMPGTPEVEELILSPGERRPKERP